MDSGNGVAAPTASSKAKKAKTGRIGISWCYGHVTMMPHKCTETSIPVGSSKRRHRSFRHLPPRGIHLLLLLLLRHLCTWEVNSSRIAQAR